MKKLSTLLLLSLTAIFIFSCTKAESPITDPSEGGITTLTVAAPGSGVDTKVDFDDLGTGASGGLKLTWEAKVTGDSAKDGDIITIYDNSGNRVGNYECTAVSTDEATKGNATFTFVSGSGSELIKGQEYQAVYPSSEETTLEERNTAKSLAHQTYDGDKAEKSLNGKNYMVTSATFTAGQDNLDFEYETSVFVLTFAKGALTAVPANIQFKDGAGKVYTIAPTNMTSVDNYTVYFHVWATNATSGDIVFSVHDGTNTNGFNATRTKAWAVGKTYRSTIDSYNAGIGAYIDEYKHYQGPETSITISGTTLKWAPVNLGYRPAGSESATDKGFAWGKLYQWGRKDGQGYNDTYDEEPAFFNSSCPSTTEPLANTFYKTEIDPYDWTAAPYDGSDENAWNIWEGTNQQVGKVGNPCPSGWRVPTNDELDELEDNGEWKSASAETDNQAGYWFSGDVAIGSAGNNKIFFPAAGCRSNNGDAYNRGSSGYYWSSTPLGAYAYYLSFNSGGAIVSIYSRADGYSVRCVQD